MRLRPVALVVTFALGLLAGPLPAEEQQAGKVYRIGWLGIGGPGSQRRQKLKPSPQQIAFREGLRELGYVEGLLVVTSGLTIRYRARIAEFAIKKRLPTMYTRSRFVKAGGLMSYGTNRPDLYRRAATYVDKILKGAKPADLPVERPTKFELVINFKTAKQIGVTIPQSILYRADKVIK